MKNTLHTDHTNYSHLVGEVVSLEHKYREGASPYCIINLRVATEFKGKKHKPIVIKVVAWDALARGLDSAGVEEGDTLDIEGRFTIRSFDDKDDYSITGNKIKVLRQIEGRESYYEEIEKEK